MGVMKNGSRRKQMSDINVVPYIDVMLVLLVVFMITAPMMTQGIKIDLPQAEAAPIDVPKEDDSIIVSIAHDGQLYLNIAGDPRQARPLEAVVAAVRMAVQAKPAAIVLVEGDERIPYGAVIRVMAALQKAGTTQIGLVTELPDREH